jgi:hypothetical protein
MTEAEVRMFMREWAHVTTDLHTLERLRKVKDDVLTRPDKITITPTRCHTSSDQLIMPPDWCELLIGLLLQFLEEWIGKQQAKLAAFTPELDYAHLQGLDAGGGR